MQLHFAGKNIDVTPALKQYTLDKFQYIETHFKNITNVHVVFHIEHLDQIAEATVHITGAELHATANTDDMYKSIDALIQKLTTQLTKHKEKMV